MFLSSDSSIGGVRSATDLSYICKSLCVCMYVLVRQADDRERLVNFWGGVGGGSRLGGMIIAVWSCESLYEGEQLSL